MTVAARVSSISYVENGSTTAFAVPFRYKAGSNLVVERIGLTGAIHTLAYGTEFTAAPAPTDVGGTVTTAAAGPAGARLRIRRVTPRSQPAQYPINDRFPAALTEDALDTAMLIDQEQDVKIDDTAARALMVPDGEVASTIPAAGTRAGKLLGFGSDGAPVVVPAYLGGDVPSPYFAAASLLIALASLVDLDGGPLPPGPAVVLDGGILKFIRGNGS